jgi:nitrogen fixation NifU-like protein
MTNYYSKKVIQHFTNPKNFGEIKNADGVGRVGNPACGDVLTLYLKIDEIKGKEIIKDIKFHTLGCPAAVAVSDMVSDLVKGKTLKQAASKINNKEIVKKLGGLPEIKHHCSVLAEQALKAAIKDYENKKNSKQESDCGDERWCGFKCSGCPIEKSGL